MASYTDGEVQQLILNLVSTLQQQLKFMQSHDWQDRPNSMLLSQQLSELLKIVGSKGQSTLTILRDFEEKVTVGAGITQNSGIVSERPSTKTPKETQLSVLTLTKENGFRVTVPVNAEYVDRTLLPNGDISLLIRSRTEKASSD